MMDYADNCRSQKSEGVKAVVHLVLKKIFTHENKQSVSVFQQHFAVNLKFLDYMLA